MPERKQNWYRGVEWRQPKFGKVKEKLSTKNSGDWQRKRKNSAENYGVSMRDKIIMKLDTHTHRHLNRQNTYENGIKLKSL